MSYQKKLNSTFDLNHKILWMEKLQSPKHDPTVEHLIFFLKLNYSLLIRM